MVNRAHRALRGLKDSRGLLVRKACLVLKVHKDCRGHSVFRVRLARWGLLDHKDHPVRMGPA